MISNERAERFRLVEKRHATAPQLPTDRPPTKAEVWAYWSHIYDGIKTHAELIADAKADWAYKYATWWLRRGWRKQPDWIEGAPVIDEAVPHFISVDNWQSAVNDAWSRAQEAKAA